MNEATSEEIGVLGPKDTQGIDKHYLAKKGNELSVVAIKRKGQSVAALPDLILPKGTDLASEKLFPVEILLGYRPMSLHFEIGEVKRTSDGKPILDADGAPVIEYVLPPEIGPDQDAGFLHKLDAGEFAKLPVSEARIVIKRGIAKRNDEMQA